MNPVPDLTLGATRINDLKPSWFAPCSFQVGLPDAFKKIDLFLLEPIGFTPLRCPCQTSRCRKIQQQCEVRLKIPVNRFLENGYQTRWQLTAATLVRPRSIGKPVTQNRFPVLQ
jgi:hypothetical protein